jgi:hypothetical protein
MYGYAKATKDDGFEYYEMLFVYVECEDILAIITAQITADSNKEGSVKPPDIYSARLFQKWISMTIEKNRWIAEDTSLLVFELLLSEHGDGYILNYNVNSILSQPVTLWS